MDVLEFVGLGLLVACLSFYLHRGEEMNSSKLPPDTVIDTCFSTRDSLACRRVFDRY